ncbi:hypothetical protein [Sorangium sp. So ce426]
MRRRAAGAAQARRRLVREVRASSPRVIDLLRAILPEMAAWLDGG